MTKNKYEAPANTAHAQAAAVKIRVSFEYLNFASPHFFVHGLEAEHYHKLFECFHTLAESTEEQITTQNHPSLFAKSIFNNEKGTFDRFPTEIERRISDKLKFEKRGLITAGNAAKKEKPITEQDVSIMAEKEAKQIINQAFEVRIGKTYGRVHGIVWNKAFHVVWIDPAHNLYPLAKYGVREHKVYATVAGFGPDQVTKLQQENRALTNQVNELNDAFAEYICPKCASSA